MIKKVLSLAFLAILLGNGSLSAQCVNDTVFTDVIYLIDNSGSIDDTEFASFSTLITTSIADLQSSCADAQVSVLHYGGFEGKGLAIEYPFSKGVPITSVNRQFCTARSGTFNLCTDGGGDDLNYAIGSIIDSMEAGSLVHDTSNNLSIVILTDAFGFDTVCTQPFCSLILPTTNIDSMKSAYGVDVTVVGMSAQAEETALAIYSSPGGSYTGGLNATACATSFDGCTLPRKYLEIDFTSDPDSVATLVTSFVSCSIIVNTGLTAEAGADQTICSDLTQSVTLTATPSMGMPTYTYAWSNGAGTGQTATVSPTTTTTYFVTITDGNTCTAVDSVTVTAAPCCTGFIVDAGLDTTICSLAGSSASLSAVASGNGSGFMYSWDNGLGTGANKTVSPSTTTTYTVNATNNLGCTASDQVSVTVDNCCAGFSVSAGTDRSICTDLGGSTTLSTVITGGVGPYNTVWSNSSGVVTNLTVSPTVTTTYTVTVTDDSGCTTSDNVTITASLCCAGFSVSAGADSSICSDLGGSTILSATITGGVGPYMTVWNNGIGAVSNPVVSPSVTTTYTVTITDGVGCTTTDNVIVTSELCCSAFMVNAGQDTTICSEPGSSANLLAIATSGSGSSFGYTWDNGLGIGSSKIVSPIVTTIYSVTATDSIGCMVSDQVTVEVGDCCAGFSVSAGADRSICLDFAETTTLSATITGGSGPYLTVWNNGIGAMTNPIVSPSVTTTYTVTITDGTGCVTTDDVIVTVDPMCGPDCEPDTTFSDVIFLIDNSGSISDSEFAAFENIIMASLGGIRNSCASSRRSVVHYGGTNGTRTVIEYALGQAAEITTINRQYCNDRTGSGICVGGGGDDLNNAIGDLMSFLDDGSLNRDIRNKLSLVILTDAFGFDTDCPHPNCSLILPTTNIDLMKANHGVDVSVVGLSSQAEEVLLGIYASPGGDFNSPLFASECAGSFDGCTLPRKYVQIEFNTPPQDVASMIADFVSCEVEVIPALTVDAGVDQTICGNLGESATLTALGDIGVTPYTYTWSQGLGTSPSIVVSPTTTMKYFVTVTDANLCTAIDSVMVNAQECLTCDAHAGTPRDYKELCLEGGQALLPTESNIGVVIPMSFEEVFILTNEDLVIIDYSIGHRNFRVNETGLYRIHTLVAEVSNPASPDYLDLSIIIPGTSDLFLIVNCIDNHDICADFDFKGRAHFVFGPEDMMCMTFENSINLCMDGIDNDGDGLIDCADEECAELINCTESTLIACNDLTDNDGDGLVDCYDPDCFAFTVCFERGANCNDGIDNDGDGLIDCEDNSCDGAASCIENSPFTCVDGRDNDGDGLVDCADPDCQSFIVCAEYSDATCKDGVDNDFDGLVDCKDPDCRDILPEYCEPYENTVEKCSDGRDNDFDGLVDCEDPDCVTSELMAVLDNLEIILEVTDATCEGGDNGIIRFYGIAQDPSFQYSIDGGQNFISSYQFTALAPRDYVVAIKSALGCVHYLDINVDREVCKEICNNNIDDDEDGLVDCDDNDCNVVDPAGPQIINVQASDCPNYNNGSFEVSGLSSDVTYTIDGGMTYQSSKVFNGLGAISYNLGFRDADGCHHGIIVTIPKGSDADNDNICDDVDVCPGVDDWVIGTPCDDENDCTVNDIYNSTCYCAGTYLDTDQDGICDLDDVCPTVDDSLIGTACDDGNPCSTGDVYDTACNCAGVVQDSDGDGVCDAEDVCPSGNDTLIGTACDDGDACTINDIYNTACNCLGTATDADFDNVCDADDVCPGLDDSLIGTACDDGDPCTTGDVFTTACNCAGVYQDSDQDGVCDAEDGCPSGDDSLVGTACDDGDSCTVDDVYNTACNCAGTFLDSDQDGVCNANDVCLDMDDSLIGATCDDGDACTINDMYTADCNCVGIVSDTDGDGICDADDDCPSLGMAIGTSCDDGNQVTENDVITEDCLCLGVIPEPTSEICDNGIDDDGDGLVDCVDNDCCGDAGCERELLDYEITDSECTRNTGMVTIVNPDSTVHYFILPSNVSGSPETYDISADSLPVGDYFLVALGICDTLELPFTIEGFADCDTKEICNNNIDDDGDGLIDCDDGDCSLGNTPIVVMDSFCGESNGSISIVDYDSTLQYLLQVDNPTIPDSVIIINTPDGYLDSIPVGSYTLFTSNNCDTTIIENIIIEVIVCKENCDNGIDDDSDGLVDCADGDCIDSCGTQELPATEICNNNIDDDEDGLIDCEDQSCLTARPFDVTLTKLFDASCPDFKNGSLTGSGQPMGVMMSIDGINYQEDSTFSNLSPGLYTVTYRDEGGCYEGDSVLIESDSFLDPSQIVVQRETKCNNGIDDDRDGLIDCEDGDCGEIITLQPDACVGKDAVIQNWVGDTVRRNQNHADNLHLWNEVWTMNGSPRITRSIIDFVELRSLDSINIETATLSLYGNREVQSASNGQSGDNQLTIYLITEPWLEKRVTWDNQPATSSLDSVIIPSQLEYDSIKVDVSSIVAEYLRGGYFGFLLKHTWESPFRAMAFHSSDSPNTNLRPKLTLEISNNCIQASQPETQGATTSDLNIKVMLQGACTPDGLMSTELNDGGYLPGQQPETFFGIAAEAGQPFNQAPWFYEGKEGTSLKSNNKSDETIYDPDVVDWVLVSLRGEAAKSTEVWRGAGLLYYDGTIEFFNPLVLEKKYSRGYYVVVEHRNHLPVMSADKVQLVDGGISYDFTEQNSFTSILGVGQLKDEQGRFMMVAGNGELILELSSDIDINARDLTLWLQNNGANSSYFLEDYDMNGDINIKDRIMWEKNNGLFTTFETKDVPKD